VVQRAEGEEGEVVAAGEEEEVADAELAVLDDGDELRKTMMS